MIILSLLINTLILVILLALLRTNTIKFLIEGLIGIRLLIIILNVLLSVNLILNLPLLVVFNHAIIYLSYRLLLLHKLFINRWLSSYGILVMFLSFNVVTGWQNIYFNIHIIFQLILVAGMLMSINCCYILSIY